MSITYCECVFVALGIQHAAILSAVTCTALQYFFTLSHKPHGFRKKKNEHKFCVLIFSTNFVWKISHSNKKWAIYDQKCILFIIWSTVPLLLSEFNANSIFSKDFRKILKYQISWKSVRWEPSCSMRTNRPTDRQTGRHNEAIRHFPQFAGTHLQEPRKQAWSGRTHTA
jgi:hypothetical protein